MLQLLDFIRTFADRYHHGKEETHFFPALERRGIPRDSGFLAAMMQQHQIERELVAELSLAMEECAAGDPEANVRFAAVARQFIELLVEHIEKEDQILFRLAEEILDEADKAELGRAFEGAESELAGGLEKYERIAAELEKTWAV
jgi:hemerythrin-like domain-containing protein